MRVVPLNKEVVPLGRKLYISDCHFGHNNVIRFDDRPFVNKENMDKLMIRLWNENVAPQDNVYILGDMFWYTAKNATKILRQLNGNLHIVKGNHDDWFNAENKKLVNEIQDYKEVKDGDYKVILSHYPIILNRGHRQPNFIHLFGHVHTTWEELEVARQRKSAMENVASLGQSYNVGAMLPYMQFIPRELSWIMEHGEERWNELNKLI